MANDLRIKIKIDKDSGALEVTQKEFDKLGQSISKTSKGTTDFTKRLTQMAHGVVGLYALKQAFDGIVAVSQTFINTSMQFEKFNTVLTTIEGSSVKAKESMNWITDFATTTPYALTTVTDSFVKLKAYGIDPTNGTLRTLGDTASAMGKDLGQAVEAMADAVTGENERLKEFGIKASKIGEEIKYTWTNASGQARQAIVQNNGAVIQSTLEAIFNSKYSGAMEAQSKTLNGLLTNIQDNWTKFQTKIMGDGVYDYLKAMGQVVGEYISEAFTTAGKNGGAFAKYVIEAIKSLASTGGWLYDVFEGVGDIFSIVRYSGETAFYGVASIATTIASSIGQTFVDMANGVIDAINWIIDSANSTGFFSIGRVGRIDYTDVLKSDIAMKENFEQSAAKLSEAYSDLFTSGGGSDFVASLMTKIDKAYNAIQEAPETIAMKEDFGDTVTPTTSTPVIADNAQLTFDNFIVDQTTSDNLISSTSEITDSISDTTEAMQEFNDILINDTSGDDTYTVITNVTDSVSSLNTAVNNIDYTVQEATDSVNDFVFAFKDSFLNTITSNAQTLYALGSQSTGFTNISYADALQSALSAQTSLVNNPFDVSIGKTYETAFNQLIDSASNYLVADNFSSSEAFAFAQSTVNTQLEGFQQTALAGYGVLDSMNDLLTSINKAYEDGILSADEIASIEGVADTVNANNNILLGTSGAVASTISAQTYYDNTGLATTSDLTGANSVSTFIQNLMGSNSSGIELSSIASTLPSLSVNTGLDVSDLADISSSLSGTLDTEVTNKLDTDASDSIATMAGGKTLANLQVKSIDNSYVYYRYNPNVQPMWNVTNDPSVAGQIFSSSTQYTYYSRGGFTGQGSKYDEAGIVHKGEYVLSQEMLKRVGGIQGVESFVRGDDNDDLRKEIQKTNAYMFILTDELKRQNRLLAKVTNNGEAMLVESA